MAKYNRRNGSTSNILRVKILDSTSTVGAGLTGLTSASSGLIISTIASNEATATAYTVAGSTIETITTLGTYAAPTATKCRFKEVDATNHKGVYEIQIADARYAVASAKSLIVSVLGATNMVQTELEIDLQADANLTHVAAAVVSTTTAQLGVNAVQISGDGAAADALEFAFDGSAGPVPELGIIDRGTAQSATGTTIVLRSAAAFANDEVLGATVVILSATAGAGQSRQITDYVASTDTATVDTWTTTPTGTIVYAIYGSAPSSVWDEAFSGHTAVGSFGKLLADVNSTTSETLVDTAEIGSAGAGLTAVWSVATRTLTAATNLTTALATPTNITAGTITTVTNLTNAPTSGDLTATMKTSVTTAASASTPAATLNAAGLNADAVTEIVAAIFARAFSAAYGAYTFDELMKMSVAVLLGKASGMGTATGTFRNLADNADVIVATQDVDGNRTVVVRTP